MQYPGPVGEAAGSSGSSAGSKQQQQPSQAKQLPWGYEEPDNKDAQIKALQHRVQILEQHCKAKGIGLPQEKVQPAAKPHQPQSRPAAPSTGKTAVGSGQGGSPAKGPQQQTAVRSDAKMGAPATKTAGQTPGSTR
ncbi:hypothetical protein INS49_007332 [Diaporthe citri]|uniref:uncharacterized protein n=1 Tax=Diaporthe citri TaxID=83186 RepID=UPI001C8230CA|nr:uncharacterized protein INS49_007332 [Diaporthe citri]KAG6365721.1 hypothetical protein INS49_007332 [Diaporthe citri]